MVQGNGAGTKGICKGKVRSQGGGKGPEVVVRTTIRVVGGEGDTHANKIGWGREAGKVGVGMG